MDRRESKRRTEEGRFFSTVGEVGGERKCPFCGLVGSLLLVSETGSEAGDGGKAPGIFEEPFGVVGCEVRGPPSEVGGLGVCGGESGGAGMFVPSVREKETGVMVSGLKAGGAIVRCCAVDNGALLRGGDWGGWQV